MRGDLTTSFVAAKDASFRRPRQLLVFNFPDAGAVYCSDQPLGIADGLAHDYQPLVVEWGDLADTVGDATAVDAGEIRQMSITLWNGGAHPFSDYFLNEFPENVEVELYQWFAGLADSDKALLDRFVVSDPINFDEASRLLTLDLVSLTIRYDQPCGDLLTREDWPYAADSDVGKGIPLAFGNCGKIPTLKAKTSHTLRLKGSILATTMVLQVYEDLNELAFPAIGTVMIDEEKIRYSSSPDSASTLVVIQRGYLSTATEHLDSREIIQVITDHTFLLCAGPVASITDVRIDDFPAPSTIYTVRPDLDPARIIFSESPWVKKYAEATRFLAMQFDGVAIGNTALQPANAFDAADLATAAEIKSGNNVLALNQDTVNPNRGQIMKAYLAVEHWESGNFASDYAEVYVSGVGVVGRLSRPNPADNIALDADVDIDHPHTHEIGGEHVHDFRQPTVNTSNPSHTHDSGGAEAVTRETVVSGQTVYATTVWNDITLYFTPYTNLISRLAYFTAECTCLCRLYFDGTLYGEYPNGIFWDGVSIDNTPYYGRTITLSIAPNQAVGDFLYVQAVRVESKFLAVISGTSTAVSASAANGAVNSTGVVNVKNATDVQTLATANRAVTINEQDNPSRTVVNLFDLTAQVNFNWAWFTNRQIKVTYFNAGDAKSVFILHAFFDIEYVPTEIVWSDAVTASVSGLASLVRPDQSIQHLLTARAGASVSDLDSASWAAIGARYTALGYRLDGLIDATITVREALGKICRQVHSRLFPSGGKLKMALREGHPVTKPAVKQLTSDNLQLRSLAAARQPLADITNRVQLFYQRDWTVSDTNASGYLQSVTKDDAKSIARFGLKTKADAYNFDLIRSSTMAAAVADFYIKTSAWPSTFYTFLAYLDQFDLEKEDVLSVTANFNQMAKTPMVVRAIDRLFGSGKNSSINQFRIIAENLYYLLLKMSLADQVLVLESLSIMISQIGEFSDYVHVLDELLMQLDLTKEETVLLSDTLSLVIDFRPILLETIMAGDQVQGIMDCLREDTVHVDDVPEFWSTYGFGSGGFGQEKFGGGLIEWRQKSPDQIYAFMELLISMAALREDTVMVADTLAFSSGFGGHLSSGFGMSPFGM
ncbi:MAG: hypothetical protein Q7W05_12775 [Deltaproteobacteria bacterium]|jgi:hypothetical protein|nr:hypothetical protein [Deltaproteobacteria bacterium]